MAKKDKREVFMQNNKNNKMTDLEIIKQHEKYLYELDYNDDGESIAYQVVSAAERMAAEIEKLKNEVINLEAMGKAFQSNELAALQKLRIVLAENIKLNDEIAHLLLWLKILNLTTKSPTSRPSLQADRKLYKVYFLTIFILSIIVCLLYLYVNKR